MANSKENRNADEKRNKTKTKRSVETRSLDALIIPNVRLRRLQEGVGGTNEDEGVDDKEERESA